MQLCQTVTGFGLLDFITPEASQPQTNWHGREEFHLDEGEFGIFSRGNDELRCLIILKLV